MVPAVSTPAAFGALVAKDAQRWAEVVKKGNITADLNKAPQARKSRTASGMRSKPRPGTSVMVRLPFSGSGKPR